MEARLHEEKASVRRDGVAEGSEKGPRVRRLVQHPEGQDEVVTGGPRPVVIGRKAEGHPFEQALAPHSPRRPLEHPRLQIDGGDVTRRADPARLGNREVPRAAPDVETNIAGLDERSDHRPGGLHQPAQPVAEDVPQPPGAHPRAVRLTSRVGHRTAFRLAPIVELRSGRGSCGREVMRRAE
jgi:hypothetical protein